MSQDAQTMENIFYNHSETKRSICLSAFRGLLNGLKVLSKGGLNELLSPNEANLKNGTLGPSLGTTYML